MLEIYLFVNPIGNKSFRTEQEIVNLIATSGKKIDFRVLPLLNFQTITSFMQTSGYSVCDLQLRNRLFKQAYQAALDFKAALFQGRKMGHRFLFNLQKTMSENDVPYSFSLASQIANEVGLDVPMFEDDRSSNLAKKEVQRAQQLACEMHVATTPATVFNEDTVSVVMDGSSTIPFISRLLKEHISLKQALVNEQKGQSLHFLSHQ